MVSPCLLWFFREDIIVLLGLNLFNVLGTPFYHLALQWTRQSRKDWWIEKIALACDERRWRLTAKYRDIFQFNQDQHLSQFPVNLSFFDIIFKIFGRCVVTNYSTFLSLNIWSFKIHIKRLCQRFCAIKS